MSAATEIDFTFVRDLPITRQALAFARARHHDQQRDADGATFLVHPVEVGALLARLGYGDDVVAAALLHDVLEDTESERAELELRFGERVAELVALVSDDPSIADEEERKNDVRQRVAIAGGAGLAVYAADKVSKVRELRMLVAGGLDPGQASLKLGRYRASFSMLEHQLPDRHLVEFLRFELEALQMLPPDPSA